MNKLTDQDFANAASLLGCEVAAIKAVCDVESRGSGFNPDGSPVTLFEGHIFHRQTGGKYDVEYPELSYPKWTREHYGKNWSAEQSRLARAIILDHEAALIREIEHEHGRYEVKAQNAQGAHVKLYVNATSGAVERTRTRD